MKKPGLQFDVVTICKSTLLLMLLNAGSINPPVAEGFAMLAQTLSTHFAGLIAFLCTDDVS